MERVITLLQEKNQYLEQFYDLNESEMDNFRNQNFQNLEKFYLSRDKILEAIQNIDDTLEQMHLSASNLSPNRIPTLVPPATAPTPEMLGQFNDLIDIKNDLVKEILSQDLEILSYIERAKSDIIRELQSVRHSRRALGAYKSPNVMDR